MNRTMTSTSPCVVAVRQPQSQGNDISGPIGRRPRRRSTTPPTAISATMTGARFETDPSTTTSRSFTDTCSPSNRRAAEPSIDDGQLLVLGRAADRVRIAGRWRCAAEVERRIESMDLGQRVRVAVIDAGDPTPAVGPGSEADRIVVVIGARSHSVEESLHPDEERLLGPGAVEKRRREFIVGRSCARMAQEQLLGIARGVGRGGGREPIWPSGVVGSITHCEGFVAAAVGHANRYRSIGIDAEPAEPLPTDIAGRIVTPAECRRLESIGRDIAAADRLLFCAKESVYKAWHPLTGRWLGFHDVDTTVDVAKQTFEVRLLTPPVC